MKLHYWRAPKGNVGDDLNAWLWPRVFSPGFFDTGHERIFFGIGSILDARVETGAARSVVFGAGLRRAGRYRPDPARVDIRFVRGPLSVAALARAGMPGLRHIADPAILTPRFLPRHTEAVPGRIGFVPYFDTPVPAAEAIARSLGLELIPATLEVEDFVTRLQGCERVVTEAMHGAILADAYRVPWAACRLYSGITEGRTSLFKWADWCGALDLNPTIPGTLPQVALWAPGQVRRRLTALAAARALPVVRGLLARDRWTLSDPARLAAAQDAILAEAARLMQEEAATPPARLSAAPGAATGPGLVRRLRPPIAKGQCVLSVIIPAHNEQDWIGGCLGSLLADPAPPGGGEVIVVANGCTDATVARAAEFADRARAGGWGWQILDLPGLGKPGALNAGDAAATGDMRLYLDADIRVEPGVIARIAAALATPEPRYASARPRIAPARSMVTRAYAAFWQELPFARSPAPGFGLFAVNAAGRARWGVYPQLISDDTFVRLLFRPEERIEVAGAYDWPMVEGFSALVRVRRRQDAGVQEIARLHPGLIANEGKPPPTPGALARLALRKPVGFVCYALVSLGVRARASSGEWSRGR